MKAFFFCFMLVSSVSYAKNVDFTQFNSRMNENLNEVIDIYTFFHSETVLSYKR